MLILARGLVLRSSIDACVSRAGAGKGTKYGGHEYLASPVVSFVYFDRETTVAGSITTSQSISTIHHITNKGIHGLMPPAGRRSLKCPSSRLTGLADWLREFIKITNTMQPLTCIGCLEHTQCTH